MAKIVLIDSGPIVAALWPQDSRHVWAKRHFQALSDPCLTCEAVVSESFFLLERNGSGKEALRGLLERRVIEVRSAFEQNRRELLQLMRRYDDTPMSFADACLVRMAEVQDDSVVFTTDSDFQVYRKNGRHRIPLIAPW